MTTAATIKVPRIGDLWPGQGGVHAGMVRGQNGAPDFHIIVPTAPAAYIASVAWGSRGEDETGATHKRDGLANTISLVQSAHAHPAAEWAAGLEVDGFADLYLPSQGELALCCINVPELFEPGWYWSSTQYSRYLAWHQYFGDGDQFISGKSYEGRARAVRRFIR
jgi:hypothetical protein